MRAIGAQIEEETTIPARARQGPDGQWHQAILDIAVRPLWAPGPFLLDLPLGEPDHNNGQSPPRDRLPLQRSLQAQDQSPRPRGQHHAPHHRRPNAPSHLRSPPTHRRQALDIALWTTDVRNRILQLGGTVAMHTVGGRHDLAADGRASRQLVSVCVSGLSTTLPSDPGLALLGKILCHEKNWLGGGSG